MAGSSPFAGTETLQVVGVQPNGAPAATSQIATTLQIANLAQGNQYGANAATAATVLTAASISGAPEVTLNMTGTLAGAANATLPTVAQLTASITQISYPYNYNLRIINSGGGAFAWTVATSTGWTLNGTMSIAQNTWRDFYVQITSASAATLQQVGTGTNS